MSQTDVLYAAVLSAILAGLILHRVVRRAGSLDQGLRRVRLGLNTVTLWFYRGIWALALGLFALGWYRKDYDLWYGAAAVIIVGMMLFRDLSASHSRPFFEWFSHSPMADRARSMQEENARLRAELKGGEGSGPSDGAEPDEAARFAEELRRAARRAATVDEGVDEAGRTTRTFTFSFQWPPRRDDS